MRASGSVTPGGTSSGGGTGSDPYPGGASPGGASTGGTSLIALQRDFRVWLAQESAEAADRLGAAAAPGLSVYLNNYRSQLLAGLRETYATVSAWLGEEVFNAAAAIHIERVPPASWTLDAYGRDFPATLAELHPGDPEVVELARLDAALARIYVGPDCVSVTAGDLGEVDWDRAVLVLVPTFTTLPAATNAAALWSAIAEGAQPPAAAPLDEPAVLALWRVGFTPRFRTLDAGEAEALGQAAAGTTFGALCAQLLQRHGEEQGTALAGTWLGRWLGEGMIAAIVEGA